MKEGRKDGKKSYMKGGGGGKEGGGEGEALDHI
jgi:hypothetical protein